VKIQLGIFLFVLTAVSTLCCALTQVQTKIDDSIIQGNASSKASAAEEIQILDDKLNPEILAAFKAFSASGPHSEIIETPLGFVWVAVASGFADNIDVQGRKVSPPLQRIRALRAAVVNAKAELAGADQINKLFGTKVIVKKEVKEGRETAEFYSEELVILARTMLSSVEIWKTKVDLDRNSDKEGRLMARVWIYSQPCMNEQKIVAKGRKIYPTHKVAAQSLAALAARGLCDEGVITVLVGTPEKLVPVRFAIAAAVGAQARVIVRAKLPALFAMDSSTEISGKTTSKKHSVVDPLSVGVSAEFKDEYYKLREESSKGVIRLSQCECETTTDEVLFCVSWLLGTD
jgi:hypothetical protein